MATDTIRALIISVFFATDPNAKSKNIPISVIKRYEAISETKEKTKPKKKPTVNKDGKK